MPFAVWNILARAAEFFPGAPLTRNQIDLMRHDNVAAADLPGLSELHIEPRAIREVIRMIEQANRLRDTDKNRLRPQHRYRWLSRGRYVH